MSVPTVAVEFAPGVDFDTDPTSMQWVALTDDTRRVRIRRGRSDELDRFQPGTCEIVLGNADRKYDPEYSSGTYYGNLKPRMHVRVTAEWDSTTYPLFRGFIGGWPQSWDVANTDATVTLRCYDALEVFAGTDLKSPWEYALGDLSLDVWLQLGETSGTTMFDSSGNGNHGIYRNGGTFYKGASLVDDDDTSALRCPGAETGAEPPYGLATGVTYDDGAYSVAFWCSWTPEQFDSSATVWRACGSFDDTGYGFAFHLFKQGSSTLSLVGTVETSTGGGAVPQIDLSLKRGRAMAGRPHLIVLTVDANGDATLYLDDTHSDADTALGGSILVPCNGLVIGASPLVETGSGEDYAWSGTIDEFAIFGSELSASDVSTLYAAGRKPWDGDTPAERIGRILDAQGFPAGLRDLDTGSGALGPASTNGRKALTVLQQIETTEQGLFYADASGNVVFVGRQNLISETRFTTSQATFTDNGTSGEQARILRADFDDQFIRNRAEIRDSRGIPHSEIDQTSIDEFGEFVYSVSVDADENFAKNLAEFIIAAYKDPSLRVPKVEVSPTLDDNLWPNMLDRELGDLVTVERTPQGVGSQISVDRVINGIDWDISEGGKFWHAEFRLGTHLTDLGGPWFTWGGTGATQGWGQGNWFF